MSKHKLTVYELITEIGQDNIPVDKTIELLGKYPLLSRMILMGQRNKRGNNTLVQVSKVVPEMTAEIVERRLQKIKVLTKQENDDIIK